MKAPFPKGTITSLYGETANRPNPHRGLDFGVPAGFPIRFGVNGTVMFVRWSDCLGWVISFRFMHKGKILFGAQSHLKRRPKWKSGDKITATDIAGLVGNTGSCSKGAHDHLTIGLEATHVFAGKTIDPLKVLEF